VREVVPAGAAIRSDIAIAGRAKFRRLLNHYEAAERSGRSGRSERRCSREASLASLLAPGIRSGAAKPPEQARRGQTAPAERVVAAVETESLRPSPGGLEPRGAPLTISEHDVLGVFVQGGSHERLPHWRHGR
jgi:hypothetical protein